MLAGYGIFFFFLVSGVGSGKHYFVALITSPAVGICWVICLWAVAIIIPVFQEVRGCLLHHSISKAGTAPGTYQALRKQ